MIEVNGRQIVEERKMNEALSKPVAQIMLTTLLGFWSASCQTACTALTAFTMAIYVQPGMALSQETISEIDLYSTVAALRSQRCGAICTLDGVEVELLGKKKIIASEGERLTSILFSFAAVQSVDCNDPECETLLMYDDERVFRHNGVGAEGAAAAYRAIRRSDFLQFAELTSETERTVEAPNPAEKKASPARTVLCESRGMGATIASLRGFLDSGPHSLLDENGSGIGEIENGVLSWRSSSDARPMGSISAVNQARLCFLGGTDGAEQCLYAYFCSSKEGELVLTTTDGNDLALASLPSEDDNYVAPLGSNGVSAGITSDKANETAVSTDLSGTPYTFDVSTMTLLDLMMAYRFLNVDPYWSDVSRIEVDFERTGNAFEDKRRRAAAQQKFVGDVDERFKGVTSSSFTVLVPQVLTSSIGYDFGSGVYRLCAPGHFGSGRRFSEDWLQLRLFDRTGGDLTCGAFAMPFLYPGWLSYRIDVPMNETLAESLYDAISSGNLTVSSSAGNCLATSGDLLICETRTTSFYVNGTLVLEWDNLSGRATEILGAIQ
jgi:hypothetical protein